MGKKAFIILGISCLMVSTPVCVTATAVESQISEQIDVTTGIETPCVVGLLSQ